MRNSRGARDYQRKLPAPNLRDTGFELRPVLIGDELQTLLAAGREFASLARGVTARFQCVATE